MELPHEMVPSYLDKMIFQLSCEGITPVIAHSERNAQIIDEPQRLYKLVEDGGLAQVTATSLVGAFGEQVQRTAKEFVKCSLVQVVASDAHTLKNRGFAMTEMDSRYPEHFATNARNLLNGDKIKARRIEVPRKQRKHWLS
ncbi:CpsB/CapC family capsule biosynthesis tyrosine phosphatase [Lactobacillus delbrueckii subsp. bulgaricus]